MKSAVLLSVIFASCSLALVCPFSLLKRAGLLNPEDEAAYDRVAANPSSAEDIYLERHYKKSDSPDSGSLIGPRSSEGLLDLPLGGGLRMLS